MNITAHVVIVPDDSVFNQFFTERHIKLAVVPRVGELIVNDDAEGIGQAFKVMAVFHPVNPGGGTASVEIHVQHVGTESKVFGVVRELQPL